MLVATELFVLARRRLLWAMDVRADEGAVDGAIEGATDEVGVVASNS